MTRLAFASLLVLGASFGVGGCGGKAEGGAPVPDDLPDSSTDPVTPPGGYQTPDDGYQTPPPTYDTPPPTYQTPSGAVGKLCNDLCNIVASGTCAAGAAPGDIAACPRACEDALAQYDVCGTQFAALFDCLLATSTYQDLLSQLCAGDLEEPDFDTDEVLRQCGDEIEAYAQCADGTDQNPENPPPGNMCNPNAGRCEACTETCDVCECVYGVGATECEDYC